MELVIEQKNGWTEVVIDSNCDWGRFYAVADLLAYEFGIWFTDKLNNGDNAYWDFVFKSRVITLHYDVYIGITVVPQLLAGATPEDNECAREIGVLLFKKLYA